MEVSFIDLLQLLLPLLIGGVGWGVRIVLAEIRSLKTEQKEYVRQEVCKAHQELVKQQLAELRKECLHK